jgi:mono/diheme cytochrome c family protein
MSVRSLAVLLTLAALGFGPALAAQVCDPNQALSGAALFSENCALCHGADAKGGKTPKGANAPDLTTLSRQSKGTFPAPRLADIIRYGGSMPDHSIGSEMPVWARIFYAECGPVYSRRVVVELTKYVEGLQT